MTHLRFLFAFLVLLLASSSLAATNDSISINGQVLDAFTHEALDSVRIDVQAKDGVAEVSGSPFFTYDVVAEMREYLGSSIEAIPPSYRYDFKVPSAGTYIFTLSRRGYATQEVEVKVPARQYGRKTREWEAKDILLLRSRERALSEAVVTATKVMMVHRGDTVVFNADYFELSQGSMLDELISRMPGLEIKEGGQIFYNGNLLSSLLVNGKDFFSGDPAIALQNLPAYTVKEVKVFHTASAEERFAKHKDEERKAPNTLDVVLKKEYSHGWITNYTLAGGLPLERNPWNDEKYLARLFALHYGDRSRLGLFGNFNNVNNANAANLNGNWSGSFTGQGVAQTAWGGLLYSINSKDKSTSYDLDLQAKRTTNDVERFSSTTSFLPSSNAYRRSSSTSEQDATHLAVNNKLEWKGKDAELKLRANAAYDNEHGDQHSRSAQFSVDPEDAYRGASLDSLFVGPSSARLAQILTNSLEQSSMLRRNAWEQITSAELSFREPVLGNNGSLKIGSEYKGRRDQKYEHYDLKTRPQPLPEGRGEVTTPINGYSRSVVSTPLPLGEGQGVGPMALNRYTTTPFSNYHFSAALDYKLNNMLSEATAKWLSLGIGYNADVKRQAGDRQLYNLHNLTESFSPSSEGTGEVLPLGTLPSMVNWQALTLSAPDSYESHGLDASHTLAPSVGLITKKFGSLSLTPRVQFLRNRYDDTRSSAVVNRAYSFFSPSARWQRLIMTESEGMADRMYLMHLTYNLSHTAPEASLLLDIRDAADPLSINLGNSALQPSRAHNLSAEWLYTRDSRECQFDIEANYSRTQNAVAMGYSYNNTTGVYTHQPQNVDGNWQASFKMRFSRPLDKKRLLHFYTTLQGNYDNSVDLVNAQLSEVHNQSLSLHTSLSYKPSKKLSIELWATPKFQHATSDRPGFIERNTWDLSYGPHLSYRPTRDLTLSTHLSVHSRRGYDDASMNDDEFVWNANVSYAFDFRRSSYKEKGKGPRPWSIRLEGFDLLHQLSNTRRVLNSQGITETWTSSLPSYVMLHLTYRWNKQPKKR
ncbi:MAG: outer membrane beta-barrel protein [Bacteroidales bacterium]|nr:outer membrane beta-barrel protein [Bacteroidales bacterium]